MVSVLDPVAMIVATTADPVAWSNSMTMGVVVPRLCVTVTGLEEIDSEEIV
jgi:hypothetical protein